VRDLTLRRFFLVALIASLCITALLAIGALLFGSFGDTAGRILATTALVAGFSLFAMPAGMLLDRERAVVLAWLTITLASLALLGMLLLVWQAIEDSEGAWRAVGGLIALAFGAAQLSTTTSWLRPDDSRASTRLYRASVVTGAAFVALVCVALAVPVEDDESFFRVLGAVAVLNVLAVLLQPFVRRLAAAKEPGAQAVETTYRFRCALDDGTGRLPDSAAYSRAGANLVECQIAAADFGGAVAAAIRALEAEGARVTRVERDEPGA
jgi:hypothetical protein